MIKWKVPFGQHPVRTIRCFSKCASRLLLPALRPASWVVRVRNQMVLCARRPLLLPLQVRHCRPLLWLPIKSALYQRTRIDAPSSPSRKPFDRGRCVTIVGIFVMDSLPDVAAKMGLAFRLVVACAPRMERGSLSKRSLDAHNFTKPTQLPDLQR